MDKIILSEQEIKEICDRVGNEITNDLKDEERIPLFVGVLKGSLNFMMDLLKRVQIPLYLDFIQVSSYCGTQTTGKVILKKDIDVDVTGRTVIIVEDVVDTGISMQYLIRHFQEKNPKQVKVCTLFDKQIARKVPVQIDYCGKVLDSNEFLLGFGLDYNEIHRNEPYVFTPAEGEIPALDEYIKSH